MSITINGATNTLTAASGLTIAGNTAVTGTLSSTGGITTGSSVSSTAGYFVAADTYAYGWGAFDTYISGSSAANTINLVCGGVGVAEINATGLAVTGLLDLSAASSGQIKFPASQNASADANTLDDYEEGTFTPVAYGTSAAGVGTYSTQNGRYTKIGRLVTFQLELAWSAHTGTGNLQISGLPFTNGAIRGACSVETSALTATAPMGRVEVSEANIVLVELVSASRVAMDAAVSYMFITGMYSI